jgi:hypothetical protein
MFEVFILVVGDKSEALPDMDAPLADRRPLLTACQATGRLQKHICM